MSLRDELKKRVEVILDDGGGAVHLDDPTLAVDLMRVTGDCWIFGWRIDEKLKVVAVRCYMSGVVLEEGDAREIAHDWLFEGNLIDEDDEPEEVVEPVEKGREL